MKNLLFVLTAILVLTACVSDSIENSKTKGQFVNNSSSLESIIKAASSECWEWNEWVVDNNKDGYETPISDDVCNCYTRLFPQNLTQQDKNDLLLWEKHWNMDGNYKLWNTSETKNRVEKYKTQILEECKK